MKFHLCPDHDFSPWSRSFHWLPVAIKVACFSFILQTLGTMHHRKIKIAVATSPIIWCLSSFQHCCNLINFTSATDWLSDWLQYLIFRHQMLEDRATYKPISLAARPLPHLELSKVLVINFSNFTMFFLLSMEPGSSGDLATPNIFLQSLIMSKKVFLCCTLPKFAMDNLETVGDLSWDGKLVARRGKEKKM